MRDPLFRPGSQPGASGQLARLDPFGRGWNETSRRREVANLDALGRGDLRRRRQHGANGRFLPLPQERREDAVGSAGLLDHCFGLLGERSPVEMKRPAVHFEAVGQRRIAPPGEGCVVAARVHFERADFGSEGWYCRLWRPFAYEELPAPCPQLIRQYPERLDQEPVAVRRGESAVKQTAIEHEQRRHGAARRQGSDDRRVVVEAQVAPEPEHGWRHGPIIAVRPLADTFATTCDTRAKPSEDFMSRIAITGSSGLIGGVLVKRLQAGGHDIVRVRHGNRSDPAALWNPAEGWIREGAFDGCETVVHLAGASVGDGRWSKERKEELVATRVPATKLLVDHLAAMAQRPSAFIAVSAVGYYGSRGDEVLTEDSTAGDDFLAKLCIDWERESLRANEFGMRTAVLRMGVVLTKSGGALGKMLLPFKLGAGGKLGSGKAWMAWVSLDDAVGALLHAVDSNLSGVVNVTGAPVTNSEFTKALGSALHRPTLFPVPPPALKLMFGSEQAEMLLLTSQRVVSKRLEESGYTLVHPEIAGALRAALA